MKRLLMLIFYILCVFRVSAAIVEPLVLWDKLEVKVCFYETQQNLTQTVLQSQSHAIRNYQLSATQYTQKEKELIQSVISANFSNEFTGIHFTGFKSCTADLNDSDVLLIKAIYQSPYAYGRPYPGRASMGQNGILSEEGYKEKGPEKAFVALGSLNRGVIVHEFGHLAGLRHESIVEEMNEDPKCESINLSYPTREPLLNTAVRESLYDEQSIMNYCHLLDIGLGFNSMTEAILSNKDRETLKYHYQ